MYNSQSFCDFQKIKNLEIDLSIHKSATLDYNSTTIHEKIISEDLKNELYNFRKLSKNEITIDNLHPRKFKMNVFINLVYLYINARTS